MMSFSINTTTTTTGKLARGRWVVGSTKCRRPPGAKPGVFVYV